MKSAMTILCLSLVATAAEAHLEKGVYSGLGLNGSPCSFEVIDIRFENGVKNPLNERVLIKFNSRELTLQHLPVVNAADGTVQFKHEQLSAVEGTPTGGSAFVLKMNSQSHKPDSFVLLQDHWQDEVKSVSTCGNLQHR
jgi:hypothetical protein